jgi:hypothetical protein
MRVKLAALTGVLPLLLGGCIMIPKGHEVVSGGDYTHEAIAFLDLPGASRKETIATLGPPSWESQDLGMLLYLYQDVEKYHIEPIPVEIGHKSVDLVPASEGQTVPELWGLFITYNGEGLVTGHDFSPVGDGRLEDECKKWVERHQAGH